MNSLELITIVHTYSDKKNVYILLTVRSPILLHYEYLMLELHSKLMFTMHIEPKSDKNCNLGKSHFFPHRIKSTFFETFSKSFVFILWCNGITTHTQIIYCAIFQLFSPICQKCKSIWKYPLCINHFLKKRLLRNTEYIVGTKIDTKKYFN